MLLSIYAELLVFSFWHFSLRPLHYLFCLLLLICEVSSCSAVSLLDQPPNKRRQVWKISLKVLKTPNLYLLHHVSIRENSLSSLETFVDIDHKIIPVKQNKPKPNQTNKKTKHTRPERQLCG